MAISPEQPEFAENTHEQHNLSFPILFDEGNRVARSYGLVFELAETARPVFEDVLDVDLTEYNGDESYELPMPATYVIDTRQKVVDCFVHEDYSKRMEPSDVIDAVERAEAK